MNLVCDGKVNDHSLQPFFYAYLLYSHLNDSKEIRGQGYCIWRSLLLLNDWTHAYRTQFYPPDSKHSFWMHLSAFSPSHYSPFEKRQTCMAEVALAVCLLVSNCSCSSFWHISTQKTVQNKCVMKALKHGIWIFFMTSVLM